MFIVYELDVWSRDFITDFILGDCLFGAVKLITNVDIDKYGYSAYGVGFDAHSKVLLPAGEWGKNVIF